MNIADIPARFQIPFASSAVAPYIRDVPQTPSGVSGQAALTTGFPPVCFSPLAAGGIPPDGADFNGLLKKITAWNQWQGAGAPVVFNTTFAGNISGYPRGSVLASATIPQLFWQSIADANSTNPDDPATAANWVPFTRIRLTSATNFYVSILGSDSAGDGTVGNPWRTRQHAYNVLAAYYDLCGFAATVLLADSVTAYTDNLAAFGQLVGQAGPLVFSASSSANVTVNAPGSGYTADGNASIQVQNQKIIAGANCLYATRSSLLIYSGINFGAASGGQVTADRGGQIVNVGPCTISGSAGSHITVAQTSSIDIGSANTIVGSLTFTAFADAINCGVITSSGATWTGGAVTGKRFVVDSNSIINSTGGGINYFPGSIAGNEANGGKYL